MYSRTCADGATNNKKDEPEEDQHETDSMGRYVLLNVDRYSTPFVPGSYLDDSLDFLNKTVIYD